MQYMANHIRWAQFAATNAEVAGALPKYGGTPVDIGALVKVDEALNFSEASGYGDNVRKNYIKEFRDGTAAVETVYISSEAASKVTGATLGTGSDADLKFGANDQAPYGGLALVTGNRRDDDSVYFQGVAYPKVKANMEGESYQTKGDTIQLTNPKLSFAISACNDAKKSYRIKSKEFDTESDAIAWVDNFLKAAT